MVRSFAGFGMNGQLSRLRLQPLCRIGILCVLLAACSPAASPGTQPTAITQSATASTVPSEAAPATRLAPVPVPAATTGKLLLTVWAPEELSPSAPRGGEVLRNQIADFEAAHNGIGLTYAVKAAHGKGGLADFVLQVNDLVPERLPDVIVIESRELEPLARAGLIQPLSRDFPAGVFLDLFAPAQVLASDNGVYTNLPVVVDTEQLMYDSRLVTIPPATWDQLIASASHIAFSADSTDVFLFHYLENGGVLPASPGAGLSQAVVETVLAYYQRLRREQLLSDNAIGLRTSGDVMPLFESGQVPLAQVSASDWLAKRALLPDAGIAAVPTHDGRATAWVTAWSYAVLTRDPARAQAAVEYIAWMNDPARVAEWASSAQRVPARKSAFAAALGSTKYVDLLWLCLENGIAAPSFQAQQRYLGSLHAALQAVLRGQLSPQVAATQVNSSSPP